jgi:tRNA(Ile2) C34 agmatinyltransferase TiaS
MPRHNHARRHGQAERPGSRALRKAGRANRRKEPCPTCGRRNQLTAADIHRGFRCARCAVRAEARW